MVDPEADHVGTQLPLPRRQGRTRAAVVPGAVLERTLLAAVELAAETRGRCAACGTTPNGASLGSSSSSNDES